MGVLSGGILSNTGGGGGGGGGGTVTSVSGTTNRVTVATGTTTPVIDISGSYVGQSSITTLGTIGTGTWQGSVIGPAYGGTGVANNASSTLTISGNFGTTLTVSATTALTLPTSGTVAVCALTINTQTASYTLVLADGVNSYVRMNVGSNNNLTVPTNASVAFPIGTQIPIHQAGTGQTTVVAAGGVTINTSASLILRTQNSTASLIKVATNAWDLMGDLQ